jgi:hypothetical protein
MRECGQGAWEEEGVLDLGRHLQLAGHKGCRAGYDAGMALLQPTALTKCRPCNSSTGLVIKPPSIHNLRSLHVLPSPLLLQCVLVHPDAALRAEIASLETQEEAGDVDTALYQLGAAAELAAAGQQADAAAGVVDATLAAVARGSRAVLSLALARGWPAATAIALLGAAAGAADAAAAEAAASAAVGAPLLCAAVRSRSAPTVAAVLHWARAQGLTLPATARVPGAAGLSVLHLAALAQDGGIIAGLLTGESPRPSGTMCARVCEWGVHIRTCVHMAPSPNPPVKLPSSPPSHAIPRPHAALCPDALGGWESVRAADGATPMQFATRMGTAAALERILAHKVFSDLQTYIKLASQPTPAAATAAAAAAAVAPIVVPATMGPPLPSPPPSPAESFPAAKAPSRPLHLPSTSSWGREERSPVFGIEFEPEAKPYKAVHQGNGASISVETPIGGLASKVSPQVRSTCSARCEAWHAG